MERHAGVGAQQQPKLRGIASLFGRKRLGIDGEQRLEERAVGAQDSISIFIGKKVVVNVFFWGGKTNLDAPSHSHTPPPFVVARPAFAPFSPQR
jgi:hypothetical protein